MRYAFRFASLSCVFLSILPLAIAQQGPEPAFVESCAEASSAFRAQCSVGTPTDVPPQARGQFLQTCNRLGNGVYSRCLASWAHNSGSIFPHFMLLGILYAPPGNASTASLGNSTQTGTIYGTSSNFSSSDTVALTVTFGLFGNGGSVGSSSTSSSGNGHSDQTTVSTTYTDSVSVRSKENPADHDLATFHGQDEFLLWANPMVTINEGPTLGKFNNTVSVGPGESMNLIWVTAQQLGLKGIPPSIPPEKLNDQQICPTGQPCTTLTGLHTLTGDDMAAILAQDLLINAPLDQPLDPKHFRYIESRPLQGPDESGNLAQQFQLSDSNTAVGTDTQTEGVSNSFSVGFKVGTPVNSLGVNLTHGWSWTTTTTTGTSHGTTTSASVLLASSTKHCCGIIPDEVTCYVSVYEDLTYHSFAFVPERTCMAFKPSLPQTGPVAAAYVALPGHRVPAVTAPATRMAALAIQGKVTRQGVELNSLPITIYLNDTVIYRTYTDRHGRFFAADLPDGEVIVDVEGKSFTATVKAGQTAKLNAAL